MYICVTLACTIRISLLVHNALTRSREYIHFKCATTGLRAGGRVKAGYGSIGLRDRVIAIAANTGVPADRFSVFHLDYYSEHGTTQDKRFINPFGRRKNQLDCLNLHNSEAITFLVCSM